MSEGEIQLPVRAETFDDRHDIEGLRIYDADGTVIAYANNPFWHLEIENPALANAGCEDAKRYAAFIVKAANAHEGLKEALRNCRDAMCADNPADGWKEIIEAADAVLEQVED